MRLLASILLLGTMLAWGSGMLGHAHNLAHAQEDAAATESHSEHHVPVQHDTSNCLIHAQLGSPIAAAGITPLLVFLGLIVAFLTQIAPGLKPQPAYVRVDCRGPPLR